MSMFSDDYIEDEAFKAAQDIGAMCEGRPTASIYLAISIVLGNMEMKAKRPDRPEMFRLIGKGMDSFIQANKR